MNSSLLNLFITIHCNFAINNTSHTTIMDNNNSQQPTDHSDLIDIIDPSYDGVAGIDGNELLHALSDHDTEDLMDFHNDEDTSQGSDMNTNQRGGSNDINRRSRSLSAVQPFQFQIDTATANESLQQYRRRGRPKRNTTSSSSRYNKHKSRAKSFDAAEHMNFYDHQPLFGGGGRYDDLMFNNRDMNDDRKSISSAPADLFELEAFGIDDGTGGDDEEDPLMDIFDMKNNDKDGCEDYPQQRNDTSSINNGMNGRRAYRRRHTHDESLWDKFTNSMTSQGSNNSNGGQQGMDEDPLSLILKLENTMNNEQQLGSDPVGGNAANRNNKARNHTSEQWQMKRRKSEPLLSSMWDDGDMTWRQDNLATNSSMGNSVQHSQPRQQGNMDNNGGQMPSDFVETAKVAFESINRLKEMLAGSGMEGDLVQAITSMTGGGYQQMQHKSQQEHQGKARTIRRKGSSGSSNAPSDDDFFMDDDNIKEPQAPTKVKAKANAKSKSKKASTKSKTKKGAANKAAASEAAPKVVPKIPLPDKSDPELLKLDPSDVMAKLEASMQRTIATQKLLQEWDRANGLPKSHSQTMVNSSRSRKQLTDGKFHYKSKSAHVLTKKHLHHAH